jgi:hypothetical protein
MPVQESKPAPARRRGFHFVRHSYNAAGELEG